MEILELLVGAVVGGLISWAVLRWQLKQQATDARAQLQEQFQLTQAHAKAEMRLRLQIEEFQHLKKVGDQMFRHFVEIHHDAGHILEDQDDSAYYHQDIKDRLAKVRQAARGEARLIGDKLSQEILAATDVWHNFLKQPKSELRATANEASHEAQRALRWHTEERGRALGTDVNSSPS